MKKVLQEDTVTISVGKDFGGISMGMDENCYSLGSANYDNMKTYTSCRAFFSVNNRGMDAKTGENTSLVEIFRYF